MLLAQAALGENNLRRAKELLDRHLPINSPLVARPSSLAADLRGWEWRYLWRQTRSEEICTIGTHSNTVLALDVSAEGKAASVSSDRVLELWDLTSRRAENSFMCPGKPLFLRLKPEGRLIVGCETISASGLRSIELWKSRSTQNAVFDTGEDSVPLVAAALSADETMLAAMGKNWMRLWSATNRKVLAHLPADHNWVHKW